MENIIVCGDESLTKTIVNACAKNGGAFVMDNGRIYETRENPKYCMIAWDGLTEISCKGILILGKKLHENIRVSDMTVIVDGDDTKGLRFLEGKHGMNVITCSVNSRATVSISGMDGTKKLICIQRSIQRLNGDTAEPYEFYVVPETETEMEMYALLAAGAVLALTGDENCDEYGI